MSEDFQGMLEEYGQTHVLQTWSKLNSDEQEHLRQQVESIQFPLVQRLINEWILQEPKASVFERIDPVQTIPPETPEQANGNEARDAGEHALRDGRVGLVLVAGGQGTRLGFDGPKGAYPVGPITGKSIFAYHAEKILNLQQRYECELPWYIMVGDTNRYETETFFAKHSYFGLDEKNVQFFCQRMMPCVSDEGKFFLDTSSSLATNPNGHGGAIPAMVENGITRDARDRGINTLSYFQVDNWAVKVADPYFIGHHLLRGGQMSSKVCPKSEPREAVGVHCICDGVYQVLEYTELDLYPQLLEMDATGKLLHSAGNTAIHMLSVDFVEEVFKNFDAFPWHCSHKKIPHLDGSGQRVEPEAPNGYKFETFVFDALRYAKHEPIPLEIVRQGEYTPIKQFSGANSVEAARAAMNSMWAQWLEAAGESVPRTADGSISINIEVSPQFASTQDEFVAKANGRTFATGSDLVIGPEA